MYVHTRRLFLDDDDRDLGGVMKYMESHSSFRATWEVVALGCS